MTVLLSGLLFGLMHINYSVLYAIYGSIAGFIFAFSYVLYTKKYSSAQAFWLVVGIHVFNNISSFIFIWLEN
jgi:membrane protease YdiL (CAAX protease family)